MLSCSGPIRNYQVMSVAIALILAIDVLGRLACGLCNSKDLLKQLRRGVSVVLQLTNKHCKAWCNIAPGSKMDLKQHRIVRYSDVRLHLTIAILCLEFIERSSGAFVFVNYTAPESCGQARTHPFEAACKLLQGRHFLKCGLPQYNNRPP